MKGYSILALVVFSIFCICFGYLLINSNEDLKKQLQVERADNHSFRIQEDRIACMSKTLMLAYNLSKWEAHYYSILYDDFSKAYNIPWEIYPAVTRIESNFNGTVVSPKGAKGMMQLLESTARGVAKEIDLNYIDQQTIWNDIVNIILGCTYLSKAIRNKGLEGGVYTYLGGPDYQRTIINNKDADRYLSQYKSTVWREYTQITYIFRGIVNETKTLDYYEIHRNPYTEIDKPIDLELFKDTAYKFDTTLFKETQEDTEKGPKKKVVIKKSVVIKKIETKDSVKDTIN